jgi:UDP-N-acetylmuramate dehydrogenase
MRHGLAGMEGLVGIPGTIGGAVFMNAGGRAGEIADVVESVRVLDRRGRFHVLSREAVGFRYRGCGLGELVVLEATLRLAPAEKIVICKRMGEHLKRKHETQPMGQRSAGCVFKNPEPSRAAAWLIDQAGLKGERAGGCEVSRKHANFIVNDRDARASDIFALIARVRREVLLRFGAPLGLEVKVLGAGGLEAA